jgi:hypothetical protein
MRVSLPNFCSQKVLRIFPSVNVSQFWLREKKILPLLPTTQARVKLRPNLLQLPLFKLLPLRKQHLLSLTPSTLF